MHADLQDPPELVPEMLRTAEGGADVVYARRIGRDESWVKRMLATGFYSPPPQMPLLAVYFSRNSRMNWTVL